MHHRGIDMTHILQNNPFNEEKFGAREYNRRSLYSIEIEPEIAINTIVMWAGNIDEIPDNWVLCDGDNDTPNLTDKFVIGASTLHPMHSVGGNTNIQLTVDQIPSHSHDLTNDSFIIEEHGEHDHHIKSESTNVSHHDGHQHIISTDNISMSGDHYHTVGDYSISNNGAHSHNIMQGNTTQIYVDSSSLSITSSGSHTHTYSGSTSNNGDHSHSTTYNLVGDFGSYYGVLGIGATYHGTNPTLSAGSHTHSFSGSTQSSGSHTHTIQGSLVIEDVWMDSNGAHSHEFNGNSAVNGTHNHDLYTVSKVHGEHKHDVDGRTEYSDNKHTHDIDYGWTANVGNGEQIHIINPYYALAFIMKTSYAYSDDDSEGPQDSEDTLFAENNIYSDASTSNSSSNSTLMWILTGLILLLAVFVCLLCYWYELKTRNVDERESENEDDNKQEYEAIDTLQNEERAIDCVDGTYSSVSSVARPDGHPITGIQCESDEDAIDNISNIEINELIQAINTSEGS